MAADLWWIGVVVAGAVVGLSVLSIVWTKVRAPGFHVDGKHVFVTGGTQGLGLALAKKYAAQGAKVTIVARTQSALDAAKKEIEGVRKHADAGVFALSVDVTDYEGVKRAVASANDFHGRVMDHVVCAAGFSTPGYFLDQDISVFRKMMDVDYFGTLYAIKAALPAMVQAKQGGHVVLVSSGLGLISWIGYAQYSGAKYALRGLAEALRNELQLYDIRVSIYYPGNIDSPGYVNENKTKPPETLTIEGVSDVTHPDKVAQTLIDGMSDGQFSITNEPLPFLLRTLANGVAPRNNSVLEAVLLPIAIPIQMGFGIFMDYVVASSKKAKEAKAKQQ